MEKPDFLGEEKLQVSDFDIFTLEKGEGAFLPFGCLCLWAFVPKSGAIERPEKAPKGRLLLQWVLGPKTGAHGESLAAKELQHGCEKFMSVNGDRKPWSSIKEPLSNWLG